jgi:hypothetical protein
MQVGGHQGRNFLAVRRISAGVSARFFHSLQVRHRTEAHPFFRNIRHRYLQEIFGSPFVYGTENA